MTLVEASVMANQILHSNGLALDQDEENITELEEDWGEEYNDVVTFLCGLHLNEFVEMFVNQGITLDIFLNLNEDDLCHIGITNPKQRAVLLQGIKQLRQNKTDTSLEVQQIEISPEEVDAILANTVKHLTVMHASLAHMRLNLRNPCVHNSLMNLTVTSADLLELLTSEADIQAQLVTNQVNALLTKRPGADDKVSKSRWKLTLSMVSGVGVVCALLFCIKRYYKFDLS